MAERWYEIVESTEPITQGDLIFDCPLIAWESREIDLEGKGEEEILKGLTKAISADVIVMTQACDLEQHKVENIILCPHDALSDLRSTWEENMRQREQKPTDKAWASFCRDVKDGFIWNLAMINEYRNPDFESEVRIVDFHEVFSAPRLLVESILKKRNNSRLRMLPPYREHLSQAFARFFMRVGLPEPIAENW